LFSYNVNLYYFLRARDQVSHPYIAAISTRRGTQKTRMGKTWNLIRF
jgi:hypothetical protein